MPVHNIITWMKKYQKMCVKASPQLQSIIISVVLLVTISDLWVHLKKDFIFKETKLNASWVNI